MTGHTVVSEDHNQTFPWMQGISALTNTKSDDDVWTILAMKEKPFQFAGATVLAVRTVSKIAVTTIIGYLDCWDCQEVIIKCNQQQYIVRRAELLQGRRPRGTIVECILEGRRQSNVVVENAHHHLADNTGESVDVTPLLASWLVRYCVWKLARLATGDDGLTTFRRQCKDCTRSFRRMLADQQWNPETQRMFVEVL